MEFRDQLMSIVDRVELSSRARVLEDLNLILELGTDSFPKLLAAASNESIRTRIRSIACWFLSRMGDEQVVPVLVKCLNDKDPVLRSEAARALGTLGDARTALNLIDTLERDSSVDVRFYSIYALGLLQSDSAIAPILRVLNDQKEDPKVRGMAAETLSFFRSKRTVESLMTCLSDPHEEVRYWAAFALGELGVQEALPALMQLARIDHPFLLDGRSISNEAADAIDKIKKAGGV